MANTFPLGKPEEVKQTDNAPQSQDTPQQQKFEKATGKDSDSATGDVPKNMNKDGVTAGEDTSHSKAPSGLDQDTWSAAEDAARNVSGGFAGVGKEGRETQIRNHYDQIVASNKQVQEWAGKGGIA